MSLMLIIVYFIIAGIHHTLQVEDILTPNMEYKIEKKPDRCPFEFV